MGIELVLGVAALGASVLVPFAVEALERPRLEIIPSQWIPAGPTLWTFAIVQIRNKPLVGPLAKLLTRQAVQGCVVDIDYFRWGTDERIIPTVPGRWTNHQELIESVPCSLETLVASRVGERTTDRRYRDIPVSRAGEEVAVSVLSGGEAFAFSSESYVHDAFGNPAWRLDRGTYRIVIHVHGSGIDYKQAFKLEYLSNDFAQFRLERILRGLAGYLCTHSRVANSDEGSPHNRSVDKRPI
jgi:hypothetical protein